MSKPPHQQRYDGRNEGWSQPYTPVESLCVCVCVCVRNVRVSASLCICLRVRALVSICMFGGVCDTYVQETYVIHFACHR